MKKGFRNRIYAWWYFCIAAGFTLLAVYFWTLGDRLWLVLLRLAIAAGFAILGWLMLRSPR